MSPATSPTGNATAIQDNSSEMDIEKASIKPPHAQSNILSTALTKITSRSTIHDPGPPPDGGIRAWTVLIFAHLVNFNTWGFSNTFGILQTYYVSKLDRPPSDIAWIGSMQMFLLFFLATFSGRLSDAGYFHQTFLAGTCLFLLGVFGASASTTYWQLFLSHGICTGIGGSLMFCPALSVCGTYFSKKQVLAVSVVAAAANTGGLIYGVVLQQLLPRIGFPWTMRVIGFMAAAMLIPSNFLIRPRKLTKVSGPVVDLAAFRDRPYALFAAGGFFLFLGAWFPYYYLGSFGRNVLHLNSKTASALILIVNGCGIAGRIPSALIANLYTGPLNMLVPLTLSSAILIFGWIGIKSYTGLVIFDVIYGIIMSGTQGLFPSTLSSLTPNLAKLGTRNGMVLSIVSFACLIGPPADGALIQRDGGSYLGAQIFAGLSLLVSMGFFVGARVASAGWRGDVRV